MATIKSVSTLIVDGDWIESKDQSPEGIRLIQTGNIGIGEYLDKTNRAKYISEETFERLKCTELVEGDVLVSRLPDPIGRACIVPKNVGRAITAVDCTIIRLDPNKCDTEFFVQYTQSDLYQNRLAQFFAGSTRTRISRKNLEQIEIPLPDIAEQRHVASILGKVDELITLRKEQLAKLNQLVKSRFIELFGDPVVNTMGWNTDTVDNLCRDIYGGGTPSKAHPEYYENGDIPWVSSKDMKTDILYDSQIKINQLGVDNSTAKMVPVNSVIMVIRSGILKHTLPVAINAVPITVNQDLKVFIPGNRILPVFLLFLFKMLEKDILTGVRAVTADNIEFNALKERLVIVPSVELQEQFATFVEQTDKSKLAIQQSLDKLETLKKSLMQEYFG